MTDSSDLVERLRGDIPEKTIEKHHGCFDYDATQALMREAADTIQRLEEQLAHHLWQRGYGPNPQKDGAK
jgi:hypothetical protein